MGGPSIFFRQALLWEGWARDVRISVSDGCITAIERDATAQPGDRVHAAGLPGMPNLHSHAFQRGMAGLAERRGPSHDSFWSWREIMYRFVDRIEPDDLLAIAALAYAEMLESGFTRVGEFHYLHHAPDGGPYADPAEMAHAIAAAAAETSIGLTLLPVFYAHSGFDGAPPADGQRRFVNDITGFERLVARILTALGTLDDGVLGVAPHSLRAVTAEELRAVATIVPDGPIHIHIAEQVAEVDACLAWSGARPVQWLLENAEVGPRWCLVHATHVTEPEWRGIAQGGATAGLCPITEANLGDGLFPARDYLAAGGSFGVGSDSNVEIDMFAELRLLEYGQRLQHRSRNVLAEGGGHSTGTSLYRRAVSGGGAALGVEGGLAGGAPADFISLDLNHPSLAAAPPDAILDAAIFAAGRGAIDTVWRRGVPVVSAGRHRNYDAIVARYVMTLKKLMA
jgi:formimidoylglutamate deiminase